MHLLWNLLFGCIHDRYTWPQKDRTGTYVRCLDCGTRLAFNEEDWKVVRDETEALYLDARRLSRLWLD